MKKYKLTKNTKDFFGTKLFQIEAIVSFGSITRGELGGYIEKEENLEQSGNAWVSGNACVYGDARVSGNAWVYGNACVYGDARVSGNAWVSGNACVYGNAQVYGNAWVSGNAFVSGKIKILAGYFFGIRYNKEEIKFKENEDVELIYKGNAIFEEENTQKSELLKKADELIAKANELKTQAENL